MTTSNSPIALNYFLKPGYIYLARQPVLISAVLGSGVAVCLYDRRKRFGGMSHFQFPSTKNSREATPRYGNVATIGLIRMMVNAGSKLRHLEAQIVGGAYNHQVSPRDVGRENLVVARRVLLREKVRVVSEDVGGTKGRKVVFDTDANEIAVIKADRLRESDWYPYTTDSR